MYYTVDRGDNHPIHHCVICQRSAAQPRLRAPVQNAAGEYMAGYRSANVADWQRVDWARHCWSLNCGWPSFVLCLLVAPLTLTSHVWTESAAAAPLVTLAISYLSRDCHGSQAVHHFPVTELTEPINAVIYSWRPLSRISGVLRSCLLTVAPPDGPCGVYEHMLMVGYMAQSYLCLNSGYFHCKSTRCPTRPP